MIGTIIKRLRMGKGMTQEQLAEKLSISSQAVSRWETGAAMPDISLIAPLCNLFDVSADELLEIDLQNKNEKIASYTEAFSEFAAAYDKTKELRQKTLSRLREGLHLYPDSRILKQQLATTLFIDCEQPANVEEKREMCNLCEDLIKNTTDMSEKARFISMYCNYAKFAGNSRKGIEYANMLPEETVYSRHYHLAICHEDADECKKELIAYMRESWRSLRDAMMGIIARTSCSSEEILTIFKKLSSVTGILFDYDDIHKYIDFEEFKVAKALYRTGSIEDTIDYLEICLDKWTSIQPLEHISAWRGYTSESVNNINAAPTQNTEEERIINAKGLINLITALLPDVLETERGQALLARANEMISCENPSEDVPD